MLQVLRRLVVLDAVEPHGADEADRLEAIDDFIAALQLISIVIGHWLDTIDPYAGKDSVKDGEDTDKDRKLTDLARAGASAID